MDVDAIFQDKKSEASYQSKSIRCGPFEISPAYFSVAHKDTVTIKISYQPDVIDPLSDSISRLDESYIQVSFY